MRKVDKFKRVSEITLIVALIAFILAPILLAKKEDVFAEISFGILIANILISIGFRIAAYVRERKIDFPDD